MAAHRKSDRRRDDLYGLRRGAGVGRGRGVAGGGGVCPPVGARAISLAAFKKAAAAVSAPDDHFAAGPDCRVTGSASRRVGGTGGCPTVGAGIISSASVQKVVAPIKKGP